MSTDTTAAGMADAGTSEQPTSESGRSPMKWILVGLIVAGLVAAYFFLPLERYVTSLAAWVRDSGAVGIGVFVGVYLVGTLLFAPGALMTLAGGFAWGPLVGTAIVWPTATVASVLAFALGRYLARDWIEQRVSGNPKFAAVDRAVGRSGFRVVLLLRLSPIFPFNFLNYALGLTKIPLAHYAWATLLGMLPGTAMYVYLGSLVTSASRLAQNPEGASSAQSALYWVGLAATVLVTVFVTRIARKELNKTLPDEATEEGSDSKPTAKQ